MAPAPVHNALDLIGNTPVLRLRSVVPEGHASVYIKLESANPTGSYKDRMARSIIEEAERRGTLKPGMTVVEATGGSTGSSLAFICALKGYKFEAVCSEVFALEKLRTMSAFGSGLTLIHSPTGKLTPDLFPRIQERAKQLADRADFFPADQFNNRDALIGYARLGHELVEQLPGGIDAFCAAVGGGGMLAGASRVLKAKWPQCRVTLLEPASAPFITEGRTGTHGIEGIGNAFKLPLLDDESYDEARAFPEEEAREMCRRLAKEEGILVGTSTGLNVVAAIALARELGPGKTVVTVACDTGLKYMSGPLFTQEE
ncbi:putative Tryptophan synthase beta chain-like PALP domain-containing protein [Seiridium cardinale]